VRRPDGFTLRGESEWPLARTRWTKFYLHPRDLSLRLDPPAAEATASYTGFAPGVTFMSAPLEAETEITGPPAAKLFLASSTADADAFVILRAFDPDGKEVLFSVQPIRTRRSGKAGCAHRIGSSTLPAANPIVRCTPTTRNGRWCRVPPSSWTLRSGRRASSCRGLPHRLDGARQRL